MAYVIQSLQNRLPTISFLDFSVSDISDLQHNIPDLVDHIHEYLHM